MGTNTNKRLGIFAAVAILCSTLAAGTSAAADQPDSLNNGMKLILVEKHGSPMIASVIFVKSGSKYESEYENGITHFLEHLLFDGTVNLSREELDGSIRDLGGYINAFTRKDLTAYMVLLPKQYIGYGLTVQADMLFNSIFPDAELVKERMVVIEEIKRSADGPGAPADDFFTEKAYGHTDYGRPVLGHESFIANIPREAVIDYWKRNYTPDRMTALVIGDFDTEVMKKTVTDIFERFPSSDQQDTPPPINLHQRLADSKGRSGQIVGQHRYDTVANVTSSYINFSIAGPKLGSPDYLPFDLLTRYLALDEISPLKIALQGGADPPATEVSVYLTTRAEFSRLEISVISEKPELCDSIVTTTLAKLTSMAAQVANPDDLQGIKTTIRCDAIYNAEKLHYYSFLIAPMMMTAGWEWIQSYPDRLDSVSWDQCQTVAGTWLGAADYVVTVVRPADSGSVPFQATGLSAERVAAYFDSTAFPEYDLSDGKNLAYPALDSVSFELTDRATYHREVLNNGLTVLVKSSRDSRVFAVNVLGKNRSANESEETAGITDFVNRCLEKGTTSRDAGQLARDLASIGANLTLYDNPWIPYDDRYTTRRFSFIKFETIEPFAEDGFRLLVDLLTRPAFDSIEVENVRREMMGILGRNSGSATKVARNLFYETLFENHPFAKPIMGTPRSIGSITVEDLRRHHGCYYSPRNMIMSIVTSRDTAEVMNWVRSELAEQANPCEVAGSPGPVESGGATGETHHAMEKEQIAIYAGGCLPGVMSENALDLQVATSILSQRLFANLREKQGLAYSTGAGAKFDRNLGWYYLLIGTGSENYARALEGLTLQTEKLTFDGPTPAEVRKARNQIWGRLMSSKLSRINQAYYLGLDELLGRDTPYDPLLIRKLGEIDAASVRRVASKYFRPETWVVATAGKKD